MDERLIEAFRHIQKSPFTSEYQVEPGHEGMFYRRIWDFVVELSLNKEKYRISNNGLAERIRQMLIEIAISEGTSIPDPKLERELETRFSDLISGVLRDRPKEFTIVFPMNLRSKHAPERIELFESNLTKISYRVWNSYYLSKAIDVGGEFNPYFRETPNEFDGWDWSYYKLKIAARDRAYALFWAYDLIEQRLAEINFVEQLWRSGMPRGSARSAPNEKWSRLQIPPFYILFDNNGYQAYKANDYDYRRLARPLRSNLRRDPLGDIPVFNCNAKRDSYEGHIVSALLAFQDGITERSVRQSFFSFWRGIEILSQSNHAPTMIERGEFLLSYYHGGDYSLSPETSDAVSELHDKRNELVHEGLKTEISQFHQNAAKVLLDAYLLLYIENYSGWGLDDIRSFLEYGPKYSESLEIMAQLITNLRN